MRFLIFCLLTLFPVCTIGQNGIYTEDIDRFWEAYDSVHSTTDSAKQIEFIQTIYLNRATAGLQDFMIAREHSAEKHRRNILRFPRFWKSLRPLTLQIENQLAEINEILKQMELIYPAVKMPEIYFVVGVLNSGGTTGSNKIIIGVEIAAADASVDATELNAWYQNVFANNYGIVSMVAHELGHTQQNDLASEDLSLLAACLREGACDLIAELITGTPVSTPYMKYGKAHEKQLWQKFSRQMDHKELSNWLYNGNNAPEGVADLGYFMGYAVCRSYLESASDRAQAIRDIIELKYDAESLKEFMARSGYYEKF